MIDGHCRRWDGWWNGRAFGVMRQTYGLVRDQARTEAAQELALAPDVVRTLHSASEMAPEAIDELRGLLLLRRELQAHRRDPKGYTAPGAHDLHSKLLDDPEGEPWPRGAFRDRDSGWEL